MHYTVTSKEKKRQPSPQREQTATTICLRWETGIAVLYCEGVCAKAWFERLKCKLKWMAS